MISSRPVTSLFLASARASGFAVLRDEPLARHTTFRIGGPADLFATAGNPDALVELAELARTHSLPVTVLGGGSNILVSDAGIRGLVIASHCRRVQLPAPDMTGSEGDGLVVAESGVPLAGLARQVMRAGWAGLEWAVSVPGTVGGAVIGNAGAHGNDIARTLAWVEVGYVGGEREVISVDDLEYSYRSSRLKRALAVRTAGPIVLAAGFGLTPGDPGQLMAVAEDYLARRRQTQPVEPSAGSVFRNPPGDYAGRLIEAAGLKGYRHGGAQFSPRHANFIVNLGEATAADVRALITLAQQRVREQTRIELVPEILLLGDW